MSSETENANWSKSQNVILGKTRNKLYVVHTFHILNMFKPTQNTIYLWAEFYIYDDVTFTYVFTRSLGGCV